MAQPSSETHASTEAHAGAAHETFLGIDSYGWVGASFLIFVGLLLYLKVPAMIGQALDGRADKVRADLAEAKRLRDDAEALLAQYKAREAQAAKDAEAMLASARREADAIVANAAGIAEKQVARRMRMAEDKIAAAEQAATSELRARVAELATTAAKRIVAASDDRSALTDQAISELDRRLH